MAVVRDGAEVKHRMGGERRDLLGLAIKNMFITEFSLNLFPPQSSLRPWHGHRRRSTSTGTEQAINLLDLARGEHGFDSRTSLARRGVSADSPRGPRSILRSCLNLEGMAEQSTDFGFWGEELATK